MKQSMTEIDEYDAKLNDNISEFIGFFNQTSEIKTYPLSKLDKILMKSMEASLKIIGVWKQSPLSPIFSRICDQLLKPWIYFEIYGTECDLNREATLSSHVKETSQHSFEILDEDEYYQHQTERFGTEHADKDKKNRSESDAIVNKKVR